MKKLYLDMDGVLANFDGQKNALDRFITEPGFFQLLEPTCLVAAINKLLENPEARERVCILSASPTPRADIDKTLWLYEHMPNLKSENIFIIRGGAGANERKAEHAKGNILIDDYTLNLITWEQNGGYGVKLLNGNNGKGVQWKGDTLTLEVLLKK